MSLRGEERSCRPIPISSTIGLAYPPPPRHHPRSREREQRNSSLPFGPGAWPFGPREDGCGGGLGVLTFSPRKGDGPFAALRFVPFPSPPGLTSPRRVTRGSHAPISGLGAGVEGGSGVLIVGNQACRGTCTELDHSTPVWRGRGNGGGPLLSIN